MPILKVKLAFVLTVLFILLFSNLCQAQEWNGLRVLKSTRQDADKLLGSPRNPHLKGSGFYNTDEAAVHIWFSTGDCKQNGEVQWKVPVGTITSILIYPKQTILLSSIQKEVQDYQIITHPTDELRFFYTSSDESKTIGTFVNTKKEEEIISIEFHPGVKAKELFCGKPR